MVLSRYDSRFQHGVHRRDRSYRRLPALQVTLHANANEIQWVVEAYALFLASLLLVGGSLGELYGRRIVFASGTTLFSNSMLASAPTIGCVAARGLQGIGAALLVPGSLAIISAFFRRRAAGEPLGYGRASAP